MTFFHTLLQYIMPLVGITALVGTYMIIVAYDKTRIYDRVRRLGRTAEGTVVEVYQDPGPLIGRSEVSGGYAPIVVFDSHIGNHRYVSTTYRNPSPYKVGDKVKVWYYFYKSRREMALADDEPGDSPGRLYFWGVLLCALSYPFLFMRLFQLV